MLCGSVLGKVDRNAVIRPSKQEHDVTWCYEIRNQKAKLVAAKDGFASREAARFAGNAMAVTFQEVSLLLGSSAAAALIVTISKSSAPASA